MHSQRHPHGTAAAALAAWCAAGFAPSAVVRLDTLGAVYAWGDVDGAARLVEFSAAFVSVSGDEGAPMVYTPPKYRAAHLAMGPGEDGE
jgi:hypothetical protein